MAALYQAKIDRPQAIGSLITKSAPPGEQICRGNLSVMRFDDSADNRKPHTHTLPLCREKRIEDALEISGRYAGAGVADPDFARRPKGSWLR